MKPIPKYGLVLSGAALVAVGVFSLLRILPVKAQQTRPVPGSPSQLSLDTGHLPPPPPKFGGKINRNADQSTPWWPPRVVPPKGAPNVLPIMTDDVGFGAPSTFGGIVPTPNLDRIAKMGLRYTNFHSTALCSPTRAALITGRNHQSVGFGVCRGAVDQLPRLRQHHHQGHRHYRQDSQNERLRHLLVRQGPQHT
jgi:arylsulfatase